MFLLTLPAYNALADVQLTAFPELGPQERIISAGTVPVEIGFGYDSLTGSVISERTCIAGYDVVSPQGGTKTHLRLVEVSDQYSLMRSLDIDVSTQGQVWGASVSAKGSFVTSANVDQTTQSFSLYARADRTATYIKGSEPNAAPTASGVQLTSQAQDWLKQGDDTFRTKCGDYFVTATFSGAEAYGLLNFKASSRKERQQIKTSLGVSYAGWTGSASADAVTEQYQKQNRLDIVFSRAGGSGPLPTSWEEIKKAAQNVADNASPGIQVSFEVTPYSQRSISNWNRAPLSPSPDLTRLVYYYGAYQTLLKTISDIQSDTDTAPLHYLFDRGTSPADLEKLYFDVLDARKKATALVAGCTSADSAGCSTTAALQNSIDSQLTDPYAFRIRLPIAFSGTGPAEYFLDDDTLRDEIFSRNVLSARDTACDYVQKWAIDNPGCRDTAALKPFHDAIAIKAPLVPRDTHYVFQTESTDRAYCLSAGPKLKTRTDATPCNFAKPASARQRLYWMNSGLLRIRGTNPGECVNASAGAGGAAGSQTCDAKVWPTGQFRFVPTPHTKLDGARYTHGMLQTAAGLCLSHAAVDKTVTSAACDSTNVRLWTVHQVK